jgi:UDP-sulfoquinovose synthase
MGVYGYGMFEGEIPEGYLSVDLEEASGGSKRKEILHPTDPGSIYHMTKALDQLLFAFYTKNDELRVTDLHQGIVWGTQTAETRMAPELVNRFDYDGDFGTVLNRFLMQSAIGYPLTVHGTGGQTRAFIHIQDTVRCVQLAIENPPRKGERVKIINQLAEIRSVGELAKLVSSLTGAKISFVDNPRREKPENDLEVRNQQLRSFGLDPITLNNELLMDEVEIARNFASRCDISKIPSTSRWNAR